MCYELGDVLSRGRVNPQCLLIDHCLILDPCRHFSKEIFFKLILTYNDIGAITVGVISEILIRNSILVIWSSILILNLNNPSAIAVLKSNVLW